MSDRKIFIVTIILAILSIAGGIFYWWHVSQPIDLYDEEEVEKTDEFIYNLDKDIDRVRDVIHQSSAEYNAQLATIERDLLTFTHDIRALGADWEDGELNDPKHIALHANFQRLQQDQTFQQEVQDFTDLRALDEMVQIRLDLERAALLQNQEVLVQQYNFLSANIGSLVAQISDEGQDPGVSQTISEIEEQRTELGHLIQLAQAQKPDSGDTSVFDQINQVVNELNDLLDELSQHPAVQILLTELPALDALMGSVRQLLRTIKLLVLQTESIVGDINNLVKFWFELEELMLSVFFAARDCAGIPLPFLILPSKAHRAPDPLTPKPPLCATAAAWFADWSVGGPGNCTTATIVGGRCYSLGGFMSGLNILLAQAGPNNLFNKFIDVIDNGGKTLEQGKDILVTDLPAAAKELPNFSQEMAQRIAIETFRDTVADLACQYIKPSGLHSFFEGYDDSKCNDVIANASTFFGDLGGLVNLDELFEFTDDGKWVYWEDRIKPVVSSFDRVIKDIQLVFGITIPWSDQIRPMFNQGSQWVEAFVSTLATRTDFDIQIRQLEPGVFQFGYLSPGNGRRAPPNWIIVSAQAAEIGELVCVIIDGPKGSGQVVLDDSQCKIDEPMDLRSHGDLTNWHVCFGRVIDEKGAIEFENECRVLLDESDVGGKSDPKPPGQNPDKEDNECDVEGAACSPVSTCRRVEGNVLKCVQNQNQPVTPSHQCSQTGVQAECAAGQLCTALTNGTRICANQPAQLPDCPEGSICFGAPSQFDTFTDLLDEIINWAIKIGSVVAVIMVIYSGVLYMTAAGNSIKVAHASKVLAFVAVGVFVLILSKSLVVIVRSIFGV